MKKNNSIYYTVVEYDTAAGGWYDREKFEDLEAAKKSRDQYESINENKNYIYQVWKNIELENGNIEGDCLIDGRPIEETKE